MLRRLLYRVAMRVGYHCLQLAWWAIGPVADVPTKSPRDLTARAALDDVVIGALFVAQDRRIRQGQERVH